MNKTIFDNMIRTEPGEDHLLFINDDVTLCGQIIAAGRKAVFIGRDRMTEQYFTLESFRKYMEEKANTGTCMCDYTYVLACYRKGVNEEIRELLRRIGGITYQEDGWKLFCGKEYLSLPENLEELQGSLDRYAQRITGPGSEVQFKRQFHQVDKYGNPRRVIDKAVVDYLMQEMDMFAMNGVLYLYECGVFREDRDGTRIKNRIQELLYTEFIKSTALNQIFNLLLIQEDIQREFTDLNRYPVTWINFKNGMYDVVEHKLRPHRKEYFSINQIPHEIHPDLDLENEWRFTDRFLTEISAGPDDRRMLLQYLGYCMTRDTRQQKFMIIKGTGGTGKSRIINLFETIIGGDNCSNIPLQDLNKRFYATNLYCQLLNSCADIPSSAMDSIDVIKKATGEDALMYEKKGRDPVTFRSYAKLLFSANKIPLNLDEKSDAYYRRLLIFEMNKKPRKKDYGLDEKLAAEVGCTILAAVNALGEMYASENGELKASRNSERLVNELYKEADSGKAFLEDCLQKTPGGRIKRSDLFEEYRRYCEENERVIYKKNIFFSNLREKGFEEVKVKGIMYFVGIELKSDFIQVDENEQQTLPFPQM